MRVFENINIYIQIFKKDLGVKHVDAIKTYDSNLKIIHEIIKILVAQSSSSRHPVTV
jgi:hypothetical protein